MNHGTGQRVEINIMKKLLKINFKKITIALTVLIYILSLSSSTVNALSASDRKKLYTPFYDAETCSDTLSGSNSSIGAASSFPIRLPLINDAGKLADAIDKYIADNHPSSPMKGLGKYFVQGGMRAGINPLLGVAQARHESGFGIAGVATNGSKNAFGRTATDSQPHVKTNRNWYKWESWEKSLVADAFPASGKTEQPDDWFQYIARRYADKLDNFDAFVNAYAPAFENDTPKYMETVIKFTQEIADSSGGAIDLTQLGSVSASGGTSTSPQTSKPVVIALDPGHGGKVDQYTDTVTKLGDRETANKPESQDVLDVANRVRSQLEQSSGYQVVMLRTGVDDKVTKRERVNKAKEAGASIGVSIHTDTTPIEEVWPQFVGGYRQSGSNKVTFTNTGVAEKSNLYSKMIVEERNKVQFNGTSTVKMVTGQPRSFSQSRGLPSYGDISLVQLWSDSVPWVYNESTAPSGGMSDKQKEEYATGIANGIKKSIQPGSISTDECSNSRSSFSGGDLSETTLAYAWPEWHKAPYIDKKPEYENAVQKAKNDGQYVGGGRYPGVDCGGFVTRLLIDSGFETRYNFGGKMSEGASNVSNGQIKWVKQNWEQINASSTADLKPGDVAINVGRTHTFIYVGKIEGFASDIASASYSTSGRSWRAPMAGKENKFDGIEWYRKK